MIGIYKITSPSKKIYIGQSTNIEQRWEDYNKMIRCKRQTILYNSLKKYGPKNHTFEIIEECDELQLLERETYQKNYYKVLDIPSLCCRMDGRGGRLSKETRQKMSDSKMGIARIYKYDIIEYNYLGEFIKIWENYCTLNNYKDIKTICLKESFIRINGSLWRFKYNEDFPRQLEIPKYFKDKFNKVYPIIQQDLNGGFIKEYKNNTEVINLFLRSLGKIKSGASIHACCNNKQRTAFGYKWKYNTITNIK